MEKEGPSECSYTKPELLRGNHRCIRGFGRPIRPLSANLPRWVYLVWHTWRRELGRVHISSRDHLAALQGIAPKTRKTSSDMQSIEDFGIIPSFSGSVDGFKTDAWWPVTDKEVIVGAVAMAH